jgi:hypothetical protein
LKRAVRGERQRLTRHQWKYEDEQGIANISCFFFEKIWWNEKKVVSLYPFYDWHHRRNVGRKKVHREVEELEVKARKKMFFESRK